MWEKFKGKCKAFFTNRAAVVIMVIVLITLTVVLAITVAMNRAKKTPGEDTLTTGDITTAQEAKADDTKSSDIPIYNGNEDTASHNEAKNNDAFALPVSGTLSKEHDASIQVWSATMGDYRVHLGVDITTEEAAPVYAAADGIVSKIWSDPMMGVCVAMTHDNDVCTIYKNLNPTLAKGISNGVSVKGGQQLGTVGESAVLELADEPHLHFEMTANGLSVDPLDYFNEKAKQALATDTTYESGAVTTGEVTTDAATSAK